MNFQQQFSLKDLNTFGIDARAEYFVTVDSVATLRKALKSPVRPVMILGGGSNLLFTGDVQGLVIKNAIPGIRIIRKFDNRVWVEAGGGVVWHEFVMWAVKNGYGGVENLSLIPGLVGAGPIQNIGAYGCEIKDVLVRVKAMDLSSGKMKSFSRPACRFGYRDSIFKHEAKGKYCITSVVFSLSTTRHRIQLSYGDITRTLEQNGVEKPGIADVSKAVIQIRSSKLPDPSVIGNCGSFFKNPETDQRVLDTILKTHPAAPHYPLPDGRVKIPAGWLIEQCGWKGKRVGNTGCYEKQALVLINYGGATGPEVQKLAMDIIDSVEQRFGIRLEPEVNMV